ATFAAQPFGPGLFLRDAAFLVAHLERPNFTPRALPRAKTGSGADAYEAGTDPRRRLLWQAPMVPSLAGPSSP
ncbi:hypothetical protein, partial [Stutzerimonas nitrititolerans]|uniref:hypothetical protein n=1 Tax=Stutzerimonas nitrititolerans TaxID=2482751 RepID=UPI003AA8E62B